MNNPNHFRALPVVLALQAAFSISPALAADFTVGAGATQNAAQTLNSAGNTGTVNATGTLSVAGSSVAVTVSANSGTVTLNNAGLIEQTGTARALRFNVSSASTLFVLNNAAGASIKSVADDVFKFGGGGTTNANARYQIDNQGTLWQIGTGLNVGQALDFRDITLSMGNSIVNGSVSNTAALIRADGDDAMRPGGNTSILNYGTIISNGSVNTKCPDYLGSGAGQPCNGAPGAQDAMDIGGNVGVVVDNYGTISGPRHAITADTSVTVTNRAGGQIIGRNGSGVGSDGTATVTNHGLISGRYVGAGNAYNHGGGGLTINNGDGDGVDIDGIGSVTNHGRIEGLGGGGFDSGGRPNGGDGLALGGGTVVNQAGAVIWGKSNGILVDDGANGTDLTNTVGNKNRGTSTATAGAVSITNDGEITGDTKVAIGLVGNWNDTVVNNAAGVVTGGLDTQQVDKLSTDPTQTPGAAIQMGAGDDTLTNYGRIAGLNGLAIDMGAGDDMLKLFGGAVTGSISGGSGANTLETNGTQTFASGTLANFQNFVVRGGTTTFSYGLGLVSAVQVDSGATLKVDGALSTSGNLTVDGTFKATTASDLRTIAVGGNYAQGASGVLEVGVVGAGSSDRINATGSATFANGATIRPVARGYVADGATYRIVSATGGLTATPASLVVIDSAMVDYSLSQSGNDLVLSAQRTSTVTNAIPTGQSRLVSALDALSLGGNTTAEPLLSALGALPSASEFGNAIRQTAPETNGASQQATQMATGSLLSAFSSRIDAARSGPLAQGQSGLAAGDSTTRRLWLEGVGAWGEQNARAGANGYRLGAGGLAFGMEADRSAHEIMGASLGYTQAKVDGTDAGAGDDVRVDTFHLGGYYSQVNPGMTLDVSVATGYNDYSSQRRVAFAGFSQTVTGGYHGWNVGGRVEAGFPFALAADWSGRWLAGARAGYLSTGGYTEQGSAAVTQRVDSNHASSFQSVVGAELTHQLSTSSTLQLRARYLHEFANSPDVKATFVAGGPSFTSNATSPNRDTLQVGIGYRRLTQQGVSLAFGYDAELKDKYLAHQLSVRGVWPF